MHPTLTPALLGAIVRDARRAAGISQTELGERIGASRFWVTAFERGKAGAELGLALKAAEALGCIIEVRSRTEAQVSSKAQVAEPRATEPRVPTVDLNALIAAASRTN